MYERFYSPNLMALASSQVGEDSLSVSCSHRCSRATFPIVKATEVCYFSAHLCGRQSCVFILYFVLTPLYSLAFSKNVCQLPRDIGDSTFSTFLLQKLLHSSELK